MSMDITTGPGEIKLDFNKPVTVNEPMQLYSFKLSNDLILNSFTY